MDDELGIFNEHQKVINHFFKKRFFLKLRPRHTVDLGGFFFHFAFRIDAYVKDFLRQMTIDHFHATDFNQSVTVFDAHTGRFGIEYNLS